MSNVNNNGSPKVESETISRIGNKAREISGTTGNEERDNSFNATNNKFRTNNKTTNINPYRSFEEVEPKIGYT